MAVLLRRAGVLGHDEAQYLLGARGWLEGRPDDVYPLHRSVGMLLLAAPGALLGGSEWAARLPFVAIAAAFATVAWRFAARWYGEGAGGLVLLLTVTTPSWCWRATEVLSDIPSAAALLAAAALVVADGESPRARAWRWACVAVLLAAALLVRYGAAAGVAAVGLAALAVYPARWRWIGAAAALALVLLLPMFVWSATQTGSPVGVWLTGAQHTPPTELGDGLKFYATHLFTTVAGPLAGPVLGVGLVSGLRAWRPAGAATAAARVRRFLALAATTQVTAMGLLFHGEPRFIFFAVTAWVILGTAAIVERSARATRALRWIAIAAIAPLTIASYLAVATVADQRLGIAPAAAAIRADAADARCVIYTGTVPQLVWYTGCRGEYLSEWPRTDARASEGIPRVYAVSIAGLPRQPPDLEALSTPALRWEKLRCGERPRWCVYAGARP